jgi:AcrR family transcriptional regulator
VVYEERKKYMPAIKTSAKTPARQRLLDVASDLFYRVGIRAIGVDTIVEQSGVGKATLYRHFPTKDDLIAAYLIEQDRQHQLGFEEIVSKHPDSPKKQLLAWIEDCTQRFLEPGFRGCPFLNALAEISEPNHPAHRSAIEHEQALRIRLWHISQQAGASDPQALADQLVMVTNGALTSAPILGAQFSAIQLKAVAAYLIDLHLKHLYPSGH